MKTYPHRYITGLLPCLCLTPIAALTASAQVQQTATTQQTASTQPTTTGTTSFDDNVVELSPFIVETSKDIGYIAQNTLAGSRLNTSLMDTAAEISVLTPAFLSDLGATNMKDVIQFTNDAVAEYGDSYSNYNGNPMIGSEEWLLRVRGMAASYARDYFETKTPTDFYNVTRIDQSRGPNAILFGFASPGGLVNTSIKQASLDPIKNELALSYGSWDRTRETIDYNQVILKNRLALRVNALNEDSNSWRDYEFYQSRRIDLSATLKVTEKSDLNAEFEVGRIKDSVARTWLMVDQAYAWRNAGSPTYDNAQWDSHIVTQTWSNHIVYTENSKTLMDWNGMPYSYSDTEGWSALAMTPANLKMIPIETNSAGPGAYRKDNFNNANLRYQIRATDDFNIELAYNHQYSSFLGYDANGSDLTTYTYLGDATGLFADASNYLPTWTANSNAGKYYIENNWTRRYNTDKADNFRATASYDLDLGDVAGHHRFAVMMQRSLVKQLGLEECEVLLGSPYSAKAETDENRLYRRNYIMTGDSSKICASTWENAIVNVTDPVTGKTLTSGWVPTQEINNSDITQDTFMASMQNFFWNDRIVSIFGVRHDIYENTIEGTSRNASGVLGLNPSDKTKYKLTPDTFSAGLVFHVTNVFSLFANASDNRSLPSFNEHVLGGTPPMPKGFGTDYGVKVNLFDGKLYATIGYYTTNSSNNTEWGNAETYSNLNNRILDKFVSDGLISQADANSRYTSFDSYLYDRKAKGWEAEIIANPDEHWRFTLNASINHVTKTKIMSDVVAWADEAKAYWIKTGGSENYMLSGNSWDILGGDDVKTGQIYWMDQYLDSQTAFNGKQASGEREYSGSLYGRYTFTGNFLKGFYIGGGSRYQSANAVAYVDNALIKGNDILLFDAMAGYDFAIRSGDHPITASIQLNVSNVFDEDKYQIYTVAWWDSSIPERIGLQEPRKFTLTAKLNF